MAGPKVLGLDHVVFRVRDIERSLRFYAEVLGCREERRIEELGLYQMRAGTALIDLVPVDSTIGRLGGPGPGDDGHNVDHVALRVERFDETELRQWLASHGVEPHEVGIRFGADGYGPSMYIKDPDGNTVELKGPPESSEASESS